MIGKQKPTMIDGDYFITPNGYSRSGLILFNLTRAHLKSQLICKSRQDVTIGIINHGINYPNSSSASIAPSTSSLVTEPLSIGEENEDDNLNVIKHDSSLPSIISSSPAQLDTRMRGRTSEESSEDTNVSRNNNDNRNGSERKSGTVSSVELYETVFIDLIRT